jgi:hypothetical protein
MKEVLLPDLDRLLVLIERLVAIGKSEESIIVAGVIYETFFVVVHRVSIGPALTGCITESDEGVVIFPVLLEYAGETLLGIFDTVLFEVLVSPLREIGYFGKLGIGIP